VVGVHVALLANGKVLAYDLVNDTQTGSHDRTRATVWDPVTGAQTPVNVTTDYNVLCSGLAHLMDGSIFVAGGNKNARLEGIRQTHIFNPATYSCSCAGRPALRRALQHRQPVTVQINLRAQDAAGNRSSLVRATVRAVR
jgi:hypothetical protein